MEVLISILQRAIYDIFDVLVFMFIEISAESVLQMLHDIMHDDGLELASFELTEVAVELLA